MASGCASRRRSINAWATEPQSSLASPKLAAGASRPLAAQEPLLLRLAVVLQLGRLLHAVQQVALRLDLSLQDLQPVEDLLGARRAAGPVDVPRAGPAAAPPVGAVVVTP